MKTLALALMLCVGCPAMGHRVPVERGTLIRAVRTADGVVGVFRDGAGCTLTLKGVIVDRVSLTVCST